MGTAGREYQEQYGGNLDIKISSIEHHTYVKGEIWNLPLLDDDFVHHQFVRTVPIPAGINIEM
jgi:hypothetical protein